MEGWAEGAYTSNVIDKTIQLNSKFIGRSLELKELIEMSYEDLDNGVEG